MDDESTGSVFGGILLIAGCCIGAGMLGLPVLSASAGFFPSLLVFFLSWLFMATTGLLLLEVNLWYGNNVSIISMAGHTLGKWGQAASWFLFLYLFYSLMLAYSVASGALVSDFFDVLFHLSMPPWMGSFAFVLLFGSLIYKGTGNVDRFNRILILGLVISYLMLVSGGIASVKKHLLMHMNWPATVLVIPTMVLSFGFHNLVPSMTRYLSGDAKKLRRVILIGSFLPLAIYLAWQLLILGIVPLIEFKDAVDTGSMATQALIRVVGVSWVGVFAEYFAFFSIVTSFLAVALSLVDFLADGLGIKRTPAGKVTLCSLAFAPPFAFGVFNPNIFLKALNYAGAFGAVILFGIIPVLMVWEGRYRQKIQAPQMVPGGKWTLMLVVAFSLFVMGMQIADDWKLVEIERKYETQVE